LAEFAGGRQIADTRLVFRAFSEELDKAPELLAIKTMKKNTPFLFLAAAAAFYLAGASVRAGTLTLDEGSPSYVPPEAFTNNTIVVDTTIGDPGLIHLTGGVTVPHTSGNTAMVEVSGTFSADSLDKFSVAYRFATDLNATGPVD
jgi:hypothetical protein